VAGNAIVREPLVAELRAILPVALDAETHGETDFAHQDVPGRRVAMTGGALDPRGRMPVVIEEHGRLAGKRVNPPPRNLFPVLQIRLHLPDLCAIGLDPGVTGHALNNTRKSCLSMLLRPAMAKHAGKFLPNVDSVAEGHGLLRRAFASTGNSQKNQPRDRAIQEGSQPESRQSHPRPFKENL